MATTPKGYPYPLGTDRVMDGDNVVQALATAVDGWLGKAWTATTIVNVATGGGNGSVAVTFPAGHFTATPNVITTSQSTAPQNAQGAASNASATGVTIYGTRATAGPVSINWYAVQLP